MEFGRINPLFIDQVDFKLPDDPVFTKENVNGNKKLKIYVGCAKWDRKDWLGSLYPTGTRQENFLKEYAKQFNAIELNATYYKIYDTKTIVRWKEQVLSVNADFKFFPKIPREISHIQRLKHCATLNASFYQSIGCFEETLGAVFLQLDDYFGIHDFKILERYLYYLEKKTPVFVEVRNKWWFKEENSLLLFKLLKELEIGSIITDTAGRRDAVHLYLSSPQAFIRFAGNNLHPSDYKRIDDWVKRIKKWSELGLNELYFFIHQADEKHSPLLCDYFIQQINLNLNLHIRRPSLSDRYSWSLFQRF